MPSDADVPQGIDQAWMEDTSPEHDLCLACDGTGRACPECESQDCPGMTVCPCCAGTGAEVKR